MTLQLLIELELAVEELTKMKMSKTHEKQVAEISHSAGKISGHLSGHMTINDRKCCLKDLVRIRRLSMRILSGKNTKQVRRKATEILGLVGNLESQISHDLQRPNIVQRIKSVLGSVISYLILLKSLIPLQAS